MARGRHGGTTRSRKRPRAARLRPSSGWTIQRLADELAATGEDVSVDAGSGHLLIHAWGGESLDPPVELVLDDHEFQEHLICSASSGDNAMFPEVAPLHAAYQMFGVHLDEVMATDVRAGSKLRPRRGGLEADPVPES